jgi:hypothetical protein
MSARITTAAAKTTPIFFSVDFWFIVGLMYHKIPNWSS